MIWNFPDDSSKSLNYNLSKMQSNSRQTPDVSSIYQFDSSSIQVRFQHLQNIRFIEILQFNSSNKPSNSSTSNVTSLRNSSYIPDHFQQWTIFLFKNCSGSIPVKNHPTPALLTWLHFATPVTFQKTSVQKQ